MTFKDMTFSNDSQSPMEILHVDDYFSFTTFEDAASQEVIFVQSKSILRS